ncbi:MAG: acetyl-CoA carboxylase biotin carboxyl carrier protein [Holosporaceae bacterium]|nr:acetyl-CoA carboxylase biotin carboxyl carrier protein [Holosporaceae bacterium]
MNVKVDADAVRSLAELLKETDITEIEYQTDSLRIRVSRAASQIASPVSSVMQLQSQSIPLPPQGVPQAVPPIAAEKEDLNSHPGVIEAQMVGTIYLSPGPNANPFITVGKTVEQGQTLFVIEAMKVMNMVKSPRPGIVKHIFVKDAQPVEYGDPILIIE